MRNVPHTTFDIFRAAYIRLDQAPGPLAIAAAVWEAVVGDILTGIVVLLFFSGLWDTMYGRRVARALGQYDPLKAEMGLHSKILGMVLVLLVRGFELWWASSLSSTGIHELHTHGALAAAIAVTLFRNDLKSIGEHRRRFGQGKIPVLGRILDVMDTIADRLGPPPPETMKRRRTDQQEAGNVPLPSDPAGPGTQPPWEKRNPG